MNIKLTYRYVIVDKWLIEKLSRLTSEPLIFVVDGFDDVFKALAKDALGLLVENKFFIGGKTYCVRRFGEFQELEEV